MAARAAVLATLLGVVMPAAAAELAPDVARACLAAVPEEMRDGVEPGATRGTGPAGSWRLHVGEMDGEGSAEALLVTLPRGHRGEVHFFAAREGKDPKRQKVSLKGHLVGRASVSFPAYTEDRALAHVDGNEAGQVLLHWNGEKLSRVWEVGKAREDEHHWFEMEDLDEDGVLEVIAYFRRALDVFYTDEEDLDERGGSDPSGAGEVDAIAVYRYHEDRWKKDKKLLDGLR